MVPTILFTSRLSEISWEQAVSVPAWMLHAKMALTPTAAGANVYGERITMAHWDAIVQPVYMCTNQKKKKRGFHVTGPLKKIVTWEKWKKTQK